MAMLNNQRVNPQQKIAFLQQAVLVFQVFLAKDQTRGAQLLELTLRDASLRPVFAKEMPIQLVPHLLTLRKAGIGNHRKMRV